MLGSGLEVKVRFSDTEQIHIETDKKKEEEKDKQK
jgi:hypothetical protein